MFVIGTAGHVDHGKSTLVQALTGIDPDRLRQEKDRGLTIELGFAWLTLPSGREVSVVDVPGHERFIKNMLMGVGGVDVALLVVAADEGVMPQTREHLAIIDLMGISPGVVAVTKNDLADEDLVTIVTEDIEEQLDGTSLEGSPVVPVSAQAGTGIDELLQALDAALDAASERRDLGRPRLPVDRSFTISGFGTVVTGTLADGSLRAGQEIEILPRSRRARIRGLQSHEQSVDEATPGSRVAVNLSGVDHTEIERGDVITVPGWLRPTDAFDASFRSVPTAPRPVHHNHRVTLFATTFEVEATLRLLEGDEIPPGSEGWAQLKLATPAPLVKGDHFVIRDSNDTLGGGRVLELTPRRHRRNDPAVIKRLESLAGGDGDDAVLAAIERGEPTTISALARTANMSAEGAESAVSDLESAGLVVRIDDAGLVFTAAGWARLQSSAAQALEAFHAQYPVRPGMQREELRNRLKIKAAEFPAVLQALEAAGTLIAETSTVRLPSHKVELTPQQEAEIDSFKSALAASRYTPPNAPIGPELLQLLIQRGDVVKASDDVVFLAEAYREMSDGLLQHAGEAGEITIEAVRSLYGTSRKYTLALLEQMDRDNLTIRRGDVRVPRR